MFGKLRNNAGRALSTGLVTSLFVCAALAAMHFFGNGVLVSSIGASAFIAFAFPRAESARVRYLVGGYICGSFWGCIMGIARLWAESGGSGPVMGVVFSVAAVFLTVFSMVFLKLEHPPSVALAIGTTVADRPLVSAVAALICIVTLCILSHVYFRILEKRKNASSAGEEDSSA